VRLKTWYMSEVVYILDRLKAIPEGEGTMLDHTIVFWVTEISMGHQHGRMPLFTAGGKGLGVNTGRCLKLPTTYDGGALYNHKWRRDKGYPHGHLLVSILNALGLPETTFGDAELIKGPMTGYLRG
jgi:hypothetical protein